MNSSSQFAMWSLGALAATVGLVGILTYEYRSPARRDVLYVVGVPEKGADLFFGKKQCSRCHAINGRGGHTGPNLDTIRPTRPPMGWLATAMWNHAPGMWKLMGKEVPPQLDQVEMAHILAFLYRASMNDTPGDPRLGELVFSLKGCIQCHSVRGVGGHLAPELSNVAAGDAVAWVGAMWTHAQYMIGPITRKLGSWPEFQGDEMSHLIAYVDQGHAPPVDLSGEESALRGNPEHGWEVFQAKCISCHSVGGQGGRVGPPLGPDLDLPHSTARFAAVLWNHAPQMVAHAHQRSVAMPTLEGREMKDVLTFLISLEYSEPSGSPLLGERVFRERGCARCHGNDAEGTEQGPRLRPSAVAYTSVSLASTLWNHGPGMMARAGQLGIPWPTLQGTDLGDLTGFLNDSGSTK